MITNKYFWFWCWTVDYKSNKVIIAKACSIKKARNLVLVYLSNKSKKDWVLFGGDRLTILEAREMCGQDKLTCSIIEVPKSKTRLSKELETGFRELHIALKK